MATRAEGVREGLEGFINWLRAELDRGETIWYEDRMVAMSKFYELLAKLDTGKLDEFRSLLEEIGATYDKWESMDFGFKESGRFMDRFRAAWSWVHGAADEMLDIEVILGRNDLFDKYRTVVRAEIIRVFSAFQQDKEEGGDSGEKSDMAWKLTDEQWERFDPLGLILQNLAYGLYKMGPGKDGRRVKSLARGLAQLREVIVFDQAFADYTVNKMNGQGQSIANLVLATLNLEAALVFYGRGGCEKQVWHHLNRMVAIISRVGGAEKWKREMAARGEEVLIDI